MPNTHPPPIDSSITGLQRVPQELESHSVLMDSKTYATSLTCRLSCSVLLACCAPCCPGNWAAPVLSAERLTDAEASARIQGGSSLATTSSRGSDTACCPANGSSLHQQCESAEEDWSARPAVPG